MVNYTPNGPELSEEERLQLESAVRRPVVYDEDCPMLTETMKKALIAAREKKPFKNSRSETA